MASFYGNMKNNSRASFIFDKVYPTRVAMEEMLNRKDEEGKSIGDGIFINRYVLVDYHYALMDDINTQDKVDEYYVEVEDGVVNAQNIGAYYIKSVDSTTNKSLYTRATTFTTNSGTQYYQRKVFVDRFRPDTQISLNTEESSAEIQDTTSELLENELYYLHRYTDWEKYRASYDCTVWMKIYADNKERYIMVAELDAKAPVLEFIDDAPSCINGTGHFDIRVSTDLNYVYFIPRNWDLVLNNYIPNDSLARTDNDNTYWYYQDDKDSNELWYEDYIYTQDNKAQLGKNYYNITFTLQDIPVGASIKNQHCYIPKYELVQNLTASSSVEGLYNFINGKYILTSDTNAQSKDYYRKIDGQFMAADESTALEGVEYYRITSVQKKTGLLVGVSSVNGYYELNNQKKTFDDTVEYPYFNTAGFDPKVSTHVSEKGQGVFIKKVPSTQQYPVHKFVHAGMLTTDTWLPNRYFTYHGTKQKVEGTNYDRNKAYYIGPSSLPSNPPAAGICELIALIVNNNGEYMPAKSLPSGCSYYCDDDILNVDSFKKSTSWENNTAYYEITTALNEDGTKQSAHEDDTYRIDIYLPELGNTVASIYDAIYGAPKIQSDKGDGYNNLVGYCSQEQWETYNLIGYVTSNEKAGFTGHNQNNFGTANNDKFDLTAEQEAAIKEHPTKIEDVIGYCSIDQLEGYTPNDSGQFKSILNSRFNLSSTEQENLSAIPNEETGQIYPVYRVSSTYDIPVYRIDGTGMYWSANRIFDLSQDEYNALSPEVYPGLYDIPVYAATGSNIRPYNEERMKSTLAPPYDNLEGQDVSVGWTLTLLKRYLSELRELAHGSGEDGHGIGLQSDWTLDDAEAFGYIYHRPNIIVNYQPTKDGIARANKEYFKEYVEDGEVKYESLSDHYELLVKRHYLAATSDPLNLQNPLYYKNEQEIYAKIDSTNYTDAFSESNVGTIGKPVVVQTDSGGYINYYVQDSNNSNIYKHALEYSSRVTYYNFESLTFNDYYSRDWRYQRQVENYIQITSNNYQSASGKTIYKDTNGTEWTNDDFIHVSGGKYYYVDWDENNSFDPDEYITSANVADIDNRTVYEQIDGVYVPVRYYGCYYKESGFVYDEITESNYDSTKQMWINDSGNYRQVTHQDYAGWFYKTYDISYIELSEDNYIGGKTMYKKIGTGANGQYSEFTYQDLADADYYVYVANQLKYDKIVTSATDSSQDEVNYSEIPAGTDVYIYIHGENSINVGDSLNKGFVVFELPKTFSNGLQENRLEYKQCNAFSIYDSNTKYWILDSGQYTEATYPIPHQSVSAINTNYVVEGAVKWDYGYQITVDSNNHITQRIYSSCVAQTTQDEVGLYYNIEDNGILTGKCVDKFSIIITSIDSTTGDVYDISNKVEELVSSLSRQGVLDRLNSGSINSFIDNYGATYTIDSFHENWPTPVIDNAFIGFYYAKLRTQMEEVDLTEQYFLMEPTRYYVLEQVPVEQDDYEIHNIWNRVLNTVMVEP